MNKVISPDLINTIQEYNNSCDEYTKHKNSVAELELKYSILLSSNPIDDNKVIQIKKLLEHELFMVDYCYKTIITTKKTIDLIEDELGVNECKN